MFTYKRLHIQLIANLIFANATTTRPKTLISQLLYKYIEFQLFPPLFKKEEKQLHIVLKVNLKYIKRSGGELEFKEFVFRKDNILLYDFFIPIIAFTFTNNIFINEFNNLKNIYNFIIPANFNYF